MNNLVNKSNNKDDDYGGDEIFDDSCFMANFQSCSFTETMANRSVENHLNETFDKRNLNVSALCCDEEINGYDKLTGKTWIYPTNYPVRDYQFNIIKSALVKNTLVSLPTGLGKTFIAAVIMYNFYRWYPLGKIVFTAPTRPLVAQQIEACYNIIAIPPNDSIEMTGHMQVNTRKTHWQNKRVFFATPQVIYNDIKSGICPGDMIRCLVIDEAHRARGNYAYCQIVSTLTDMGHKTYRILALSATPGSKVEDVTNVVKNLHIAHLELRMESCIDVAPYSHARNINTVIIQLGPELTQLRQQYVEILDTYARTLKQLNILPNNVGNLSKGRVVMLYKEYQNKDRGARHPHHNHIMKDFTLLIALYHGLELLIKHGSRVFLNFFDEHPEKSWIQADDRLTALLERLRDDLGINPLSLNCSMLPDGTIPEVPKYLSFGHPKFYKLKEIMLEHFNRAKQTNKDTRAIVFCEYRESVNLVHCLLLQCRPLIVPQMFVGQGASGKDGKAVISQKQQLRAMRAFREGACNALVATCVAEEGLDVGSVDLIVCFDISTRSPVRLVQRCGRTGRERSGQVFILVTEGREHQILMDCIRQRDGLNNKILQSKEVENNLYKHNPRMMPHDFNPECQKMFITVPKRDTAKDKSKDSTEKINNKGQKDVLSMLHKRSSSSSSNSSIREAVNSTNLITQEEFQKIFPDGYYDTKHIGDHKEFIAMNKSAFQSECQNVPKLTTWLEWQRTLQTTGNIGHSKDSEILVSLLQYCDAKRFDLPASTQNPTFSTQDLATQHIKFPTLVKQKQTKKKQKNLPKNIQNKKDGDIRALFSVATKSTKSYTKLIKDLGIQDDGGIPTNLLNLFVDLALDNTNTINQCYICQHVCNCKIIKNIRKQNKPQNLLTFLSDPKLPDLSLLDDINADTIKKCVQKEDNHLYERDFSASNKNETDVENRHNGTNFDLEIDFETLDEIKSPDDKAQKDNHNENSEKNFDLGDIEDIFEDSSPEGAVEKEETEENKNPSDQKEALGFFGLESIDDIFADSDESVDKTSSELNKKVPNSPKISESNDNQPKVDKEDPLSPSILSGKIKSNISTSPILPSQNRKFQLSIKKHKPQSLCISNVKRRLQDSFNENNNLNEETRDIRVLENDRDSLADTSNKSMFTITQLVEMINTSKHDKSAMNNPISSTLNNNVSNKVYERSASPVLLTQAQKNIISINSSNNANNHLNEGRRSSSSILLTHFTDTNINKTETSKTNKSKTENLIILDSDSDSDDNARRYNVEDKNDQSKLMESSKSLVSSKRKFETHNDINDGSVTASPYFNKRFKLDNEDKKSLTLQEKVLAALTSSKVNKEHVEYNTDVNYFSTKCLSQKENKEPRAKDKKRTNSDDESEYFRKTNLEMLQMFRRDSKVNSPKKKLNTLIGSRSNGFKKRTILSDDSDDDFVEHKNSRRSQTPTKKDNKRETTNHKIRKIKKKISEFLDLEAELSDDGEASDDELSDDSAGSVADFICDENVTNHVDMQAHYIQSVKSPIKGVFKIPELPQKYYNIDVLSQAVENDTYEMDSFCVDSHIGLTQVNDMSELELAELVLEVERKSKKKRKAPEETLQIGDSPMVKHKNKCFKRQILSDSDDSS